jgi:CRISPR system Cascade subunit CasA
MTARMKTECFNLVDEPWLPVTLADNFPDVKNCEPLPRVSLREAFEHGDKIVDLHCYPHERIALMRLLICIAQRALNGPEDEDDWKGCGTRLASEALAYLDKHKDCFNLFGNGPRFLQAHGTGKPGEMTAFRLALIDKDTPVLFDAHIQPGATLEMEELAVALVTFQSFAAGGKSGGSEPSPAGRKTKAGKIKHEPQSGEAALCREGGALHALILGANLSETIHRNLLCRTQIAPPVTWRKTALPVWEYKKSNLVGLPESDIKTDYLGRLVPLARAVWLREDQKTAEIANGLRYGVFADSKEQKTKKIKLGTGIREPTASIEPGRRDADKCRLVSASAGDGVPKAVWRELHSIAVLRRSAKRGGPIALDHLSMAETQETVLWCGALVGDQAKVGDVIESVFRLPKQFLEDADAALVDDLRKQPGPNQTYRHGVGFADYWAGKLQWAVQVYHQQFNDDIARKQNAERGKRVKNQAAMRYWTTLEPPAERVLLHDVAVNSDKYCTNDKDWMAKSPWGREVWKAAHDAYDFACPHGTPRQLRAYAAGLAVLRGESRKKSAADREADDTNDSTEGDES